MSVFEHPAYSDHEQVVFCRDPFAGLSAIIAVHDTTLGPALGGCRMWPYADSEAALTDVLRLAEGMTLKSALAGLPFGGGKSVIIADPRNDKTPALFEAMGRQVDALGGRYIIAEDVGTSVPDLELVRRTTRHVAGISEGGAGDPSPATAYGVFHGIKAAVAHKLGQQDLEGVRVAIQGLGHVGFTLAGYLHDAGAKLIVADISSRRSEEAVARFDAEMVSPEAILSQQADVFAPCALGAVLNDETIPTLKAPIVAGSANNQLAELRHGEMLKDRGVLYAPDFAINAGGIINISHEGRYDRERAFAHVAGIADTLSAIFRLADRENIATAAAADRLARETLEKADRKAA